MSKLVILAENNCIKYLREHGLYPSEFYTDVEMFKERSMFFNDVTVLMLFSGSDVFSHKQADELIRLLDDRALSLDKAVSDLIILSNTVMPNCKDYFLYQNTPFSCVRYSKAKPTSGTFDLHELQYEHAKTTVTYMRDADYGFAPDALERVRQNAHADDDILSLIRIPKFG